MAKERVKIFGGDVMFKKIETQVNDFIENEVGTLIDIKISESATNDEWSTTVLVIYIPEEVLR